MGDVANRTPEQLASQLWGRLHGSDEPEVGDFLQACVEAQEGPWLRPLQAILTAPGGPLILALEGHSDPVTSVAVTAAGQVVSRQQGPAPHDLPVPTDERGRLDDHEAIQQLPLLHPRTR